MKYTNLKATESCSLCKAALQLVTQSFSLHTNFNDEKFFHKLITNIKMYTLQNVRYNKYKNYHCQI